MADELLRGWKEIARFLGTSERSAQRLVADGLPIRRRGGPHSVVTAFPEELREWQRLSIARSRSFPNGGDGGGHTAPVGAHEPAEEPKSLRRRLLMAAPPMCAVAAMAGAWLAWSRPAGPLPPPTAPAEAPGVPIVVLRLYGSNGVAFTTSVPSGATGTVQLPDGVRVLLSPTLTTDMLHVSVTIAYAGGAPTWVGTADVKQGVRTLFKYKVRVEIEWVRVSGRVFRSARGIRVRRRGAGFRLPDVATLRATALAADALDRAGADRHLLTRDAALRATIRDGLSLRTSLHIHPAGGNRRGTDLERGRHPELEAKPLDRRASLLTRARVDGDVHHLEV